MSINDSAVAPPILLSDVEAERLTTLALQAQAAHPEVSELLLGEIERAQTCDPEQLPDDVVRMHSIVQFVDDTHGREQALMLTYPSEADIALGKISILSHVGAGLIGLTKGQKIQWPNRDGRPRSLHVLGVSRPCR